MAFSHQLIASKARFGQLWMKATKHAKIHHPKLDKFNIIKICKDNLISLAMGSSETLKDDATHMLEGTNESEKVKSAVTRLPNGDKMKATKHAKIHHPKLDKFNIIKICNDHLISLAGGSSETLKVLSDDATHLLEGINESEKVKSSLTKLPKGDKYTLTQNEDLGEIELVPYANAATKLNLLQYWNRYAPYFGQVVKLNRHLCTDESKPKKIGRIVSDGSYRWTGKIGGLGYWFRCEASREFLEAYSGRSSKKEDLLNIEMCEYDAMKDGIVEAVKLFDMIILEVDSKIVLDRLKPCLENASLPIYPQKKKEEEEVDFQKRVATYWSIVDLLNSIPKGVYVRLEQIKGSENHLSDLLARLSLHLDSGKSRRYKTIDDIKAEYQIVRKKVDLDLAAMDNPKDKTEKGKIEKGLKVFKEEDWDAVAAKVKARTLVLTAADFILWKGLPN